MPRSSVRLRRVVAVAAVAVVAASFSGPAYAKDGFEAKGSGATQGTVRGTKTTTDVRPAHPIRLPGAPDLPGLPGQPQVMGAAAAACVGAVVGVAAAAAGMNLLGLPPAVINANGACTQTDRKSVV